MKLNRMSFFTLIFALSFTCIAIHAQNPQQFKILNNYNSIPFEDGKTVIAEVIFTGYDDDSMIKKALKYYKSSIESGDLFYGSKVSKTVKAIREYLATDGHYNAEIKATGEKLPDNKMRLSFSINQGEQSKVDQIRFEGNVNVTDDELAQNIKECSGNRWKIFDKRFYDYVTQICSRKFLASKGYLKAEIKNILYQPDGNKNVVAIRVEEGTRYRLGEIKIEGLSVFSKEQFLTMFGQKTGEIANSKVIQDLLYEKLKVAYNDLGYVYYDADIEPYYIKPTIDGQDGLLNLKIIIDEGRQFRIRKIEIVCPALMKIQKIRKVLGLTVGEIYRQEELEKGIKRINDLKEFKFVDKDKDVELRTDEESGNLNLVVKINPK